MIEISDLVILMSLLDSITLSFVPDRCNWSLDSSGSYTCESSFDFLVKNPSNQLMPLTFFFLEN